MSVIMSVVFYYRGRGISLSRGIFGKSRALPGKRNRIYKKLISMSYIPINRNINLHSINKEYFNPKNHSPSNPKYNHPHVTSLQSNLSK